MCHVLYVDEFSPLFEIGTTAVHFYTEGQGEVTVAELCPPKFICGSLNSQYDGILKWGLWEVIKFRRAHGSGALMIRDFPIRDSFLLSCHTQTQ